MSRLVLSTLLLALGAAPAYAGAGLDPQTNRPYDLQVVLHFSKHPLVKTEYFQDQVERELRDNLRVALGKLATVSMARKHLWLPEIDDKGLKVLDSYKAVSETKTHFVLIDFVNGKYEIQTRQHDGLTGLASPVVRTRLTADRQLVARTATLMVDQDFGLVGTPLSSLLSSNDKVELAVKGSGLGVDLDHWIKKDEVFAISVITRNSQGLHPDRAPWALLQVVGKKLDNGNYPCALLARYSPAVPEMPALVGYRCLKLGTAQAHLTLRVTDNTKVHAPLNHRQVLIRTSRTDPEPLEHFTTRPDGVVKTEKTYSHVAWVHILTGADTLANMPVEVLENYTLDCDVRVDAKSEERGQITLRFNRWRRRILYTIATANTTSKDLDEIAKVSHQDALKKAEIARKGLAEDIKVLREEGAALETAAKSLSSSKLDFEDAKQRLTELEGLSQELQEYIDKLYVIENVENDPKKKEHEILVGNAKKKEKEAEFEEAIELYDKLPKDLEGNEPLKKQIKKLKEDWELKGPDKEKHRKARDFIYKTWRTLKTLTEIRDNISEARQAFETCKELGDFLTPQMMLKANSAHVSTLEKAADNKPESKEDEEQQAKVIADVSEQLSKLDKDVREYLNPKKPKSEKE